MPELPRHLRRAWVREALTDEDTPESLLLRRTAYAELRAAVAKLNPYEAEVVRRHFGLDGGEPETYPEMSVAMGRHKSSLSSTTQRALWHLGRLLKPPPEPLPPGLDDEEAADLLQLAHDCPPLSWGARVLVNLSARGLVREGRDEERKWVVTERGAVTARFVNADPFKPYRCRCHGKWATCPVCRAVYHTHSLSGFYLPPRCKTCRGELEAANDQGPHLWTSRRKNR